MQLTITEPKREAQPQTFPAMSRLRSEDSAYGTEISDPLEQVRKKQQQIILLHLVSCKMIENTVTDAQYFLEN